MELHTEIKLRGPLQLLVFKLIQSTRWVTELSLNHLLILVLGCVYDQCARFGNFDALFWLLFKHLLEWTDVCCWILKINPWRWWYSFCVFVCPYCMSYCLCAYKTLLSSWCVCSVFPGTAISRASTGKSSWPTCVTANLKPQAKKKVQTHTISVYIYGSSFWTVSGYGLHHM